MTVQPPLFSNHPLINGRVLLPGGMFTAENRISGRTSTYTYSGRMGLSCSGEQWVQAADRRGNARSIPVAAILSVRLARQRKVS